MTRKALPLVPPEIKTLVPYAAGKPLAELERELGITNAIKLASNECPLGPSPKALAALAAILPDLHRYPDGAGYDLRAKLAQWHGVSLDHICLGNGSSEIIEFVCRAYLRPGDEALTAAYPFLMYKKLVRSAGADFRETPLDQDLKIDLKALAQAVGPRTKIIFVNNPHNPCGTSLNKQELEQFLNQVPAGVLVILDEAYIDFADSSVAQGQDFLNHDTPVLVMRTFSKIAGLAGLRIGYGLAAPEVIDPLQRVRPPFNTSVPSQAAALAALDDTEFLAKHYKLVQDGRRQLYAGFKELGFTCWPSQANFVLVKIGPQAVEAADRLLRKGVIVRKMDSYQMPENLRISVGLPAENDRFLRELKSIWKELA